MPPPAAPAGMLEAERVAEGGPERGGAKGAGGEEERRGRRRDRPPGREGFGSRRSREGRGADSSRIARRIQPSKAMSGPNDESFPDSEKNPDMENPRRAER